MSLNSKLIFVLVEIIFKDEIRSKNRFTGVFETVKLVVMKCEVC